MEKQKLLYQQARLHNRGAAEMVLQTISASKGRISPTFHFYTLNIFIFKSNSIGKQISFMRLFMKIESYKSVFKTFKECITFSL